MLALCWYYHLPSIAPDEEVGDLWRESLGPLMSLHRRLQLPVTLAITGSLLERLEMIDPAAQRAIAEPCRDGLVEMAGTFLHEIFPPAVPYRYLADQLARDVETKKRMIGYAPTTFLPPNFTWVSIMSELLGAAGFKRLILEQGHFTACCKTQTWRWKLADTAELRTFLLDTTLDCAEALLPYVHDVYVGGKTDRLIVRFRDLELVKHLSFGTTGAIHKPLDPGALDAAAKLAESRLAQGLAAVVADDGDRVNPISLSSYERFLHHFHKAQFACVRDLPVTRPGDLPYLPSHSVASLQEFWLTDADAVHYLRLLEDIYVLEEKGRVARAEVLELQDVFFLFWKVHARKRRYLERIHDLLQRREGEP